MGKKKKTYVKEGIHSQTYPRRKGSNMKLINIWLPVGIIDRLDFLVSSGLYPNRSDAIRTFVTDGVKEEVIEAGLTQSKDVSSMPQRKP